MCRALGVKRAGPLLLQLRDPKRLSPSVLRSILQAQLLFMEEKQAGLRLWGAHGGIQHSPAKK